MPTHTSHHILGTSANLLGFCLVVITSLHFADKTTNTVVDEAASVISMLLILSCIFSFAALKTKAEGKAIRLETTAEYLFLASLIGIFIVVGFITFKYWLR